MEKQGILSNAQALEPKILGSLSWKFAAKHMPNANYVGLKGGSN